MLVAGADQRLGQPAARGAELDDTQAGMPEI